MPPGALVDRVQGLPPLDLDQLKHMGQNVKDHRGELSQQQNTINARFLQVSKIVKSGSKKYELFFPGKKKAHTYDHFSYIFDILS